MLRRPQADRALPLLALGLTYALFPLPTLVAQESEEDPVRRVVSLIPAATEILFAIGAGDRVVGRTRWGVHPPEAAGVPDVGDGIRPSLETVMAREPDLVVLFDGPDNEGVARRLQALGVATLPLTHNEVADLERNIGVLGAAVGCEGAAHELADRVRRELSEIGEAMSGVPPRSVYYDVWADPPITIGRGSYLDSLISLAGGRNVFGERPEPSPRVSLEAIVLADPDLVILPISGDPSDPNAGSGPARRPGWSHVPAVADGRVARVDADLVGRLGPRVGDATRELARAIHPGRIRPLPSSARPPLVCES